MVPRGPSFGIGSAHAQNAPANRKTRPSHPRSRLRSAPSSELALRLFQRHEKCAISCRTTRCVDARPTRARACVPRTRAIAIRRPANSRYACSKATKSLRIHAAQCVALHRLLVDACSNEEPAVPRTRINFIPAPRRVY